MYLQYSGRKQKGEDRFQNRIVEGKTHVNKVDDQLDAKITIY